MKVRHLNRLRTAGEWDAGFEPSTGRGTESFLPAGYGNSTVERRDAGRFAGLKLSIVNAIDRKEMSGNGVSGPPDFQTFPRGACPRPPGKLPPFLRSWQVGGPGRKHPASTLSTEKEILITTPTSFYPEYAQENRNKNCGSWHRTGSLMWLRYSWLWHWTQGTKCALYISVREKATISLIEEKHWYVMRDVRNFCVKMGAGLLTPIGAPPFNPFTPKFQKYILPTFLRRNV